jgi:hypothetical protein
MRERGQSDILIILEIMLPQGKRDPSGLIPFIDPEEVEKY